ncbi:MAG: hypothetical protein AABZ06_10580 [Bdellovibrionota bacterium]
MLAFLIYLHYNDIPLKVDFPSHGAFTSGIELNPVLAKRIASLVNADKIQGVSMLHYEYYRDNVYIYFHASFPSGGFESLRHYSFLVRSSIYNTDWSKAEIQWNASNTLCRPGEIKDGDVTYTGFSTDATKQKENNKPDSKKDR